MRSSRSHIQAHCLKRCLWVEVWRSASKYTGTSVVVFQPPIQERCMMQLIGGILPVGEWVAFGLCGKLSPGGRDVSDMSVESEI